MTLQERIAKGERAIAQAKAFGRDVSSWEAHLTNLKEAAKKDSRSLPSLQGYKAEVTEGIEHDPVLTTEQWYPHFREFHHKVTAETPKFDYLWLKEHHPGLYRSIKAKEDELDALQEAKLSQVMAIMGEWRNLILKAEFEKNKNERGIPHNS